jgi:hypothetical protein
MPSEERVSLATQALAAPMSAFKSALAMTLEQIRGIQSNGGSGENGRVNRFAVELGEFAQDRIDIDRFAALFAGEASMNSVNTQRIDRAYQTMSELIAQGDNLFVLNVESGGNLRDSVAKMLEHLGTAFGAARVVELSRTGRYQFSDHAQFFSAFPFREWSATERRIAPPVIVLVDGKDLSAASLAEFLDGSQKIVLVARGETTPVPLVRLITPSTFVMQATEATALERLAEWEGPGIAALVPESAARFVHDPAVAVGRGLVIDFVPEDKPRKPLGGFSAAQQAEELRQLTALRDGAPAGVVTTSEAPGTGSPPAAADPVDKLAAWLLQQADLSDGG